MISNPFEEKTIRDHPELVRMLQGRNIDPDEVYSVEYFHALNGEPVLRNVQMKPSREKSRSVRDS